LDVIITESAYILVILVYTTMKSISLMIVAISIAISSAFMPTQQIKRSPALHMQGDGLKIDMKGKTVFIGGVADSTGYGWAIAKACAEAGAKILLGTWPPVLPVFQMGIERGQFEADSVLSDGSKLEISKVGSR
jgi:enoyl-[acyl-carrier protein] reductase I